MVYPSEHFAQLRSGKSILYRYEKIRDGVWAVATDALANDGRAGYLHQTPTGKRWVHSFYDDGRRPSAPFDTRKNAALSLLHAAFSARENSL